MMRNSYQQMNATMPASINAESRTDVIPSSSFQHTSDDNNLGLSTQQIADGGPFVNVDVSYFFDSSSADLSTSAVLQYCKRRVLIPYFRLLALLGWRRILNVTQNEDPGYCVKIINIGYLILVITFVLLGYVLQYAACFRKDGFLPYTNETAYQFSIFPRRNYKFDIVNINKSEIVKENINQVCSGNIISVYIIPDLLHFLSYLYMLRLMRTPENEQLQTLMERVFLQSSLTQSWHFSQRKLVRKLRMLLGMGFCWLIISIIAQIFHVFSNLNLKFTWMEAQAETAKIPLICLMLICLMWSDAICVAIATSYSVYCQLIISYLHNLCGSVREKTLTFQDFIRDLQESRKFIKHLNNDQAVGVSLLILNIGSITAVAIYGILTGKNHSMSNPFSIISLLINIILWISLLANPIIQGIRLTGACSSVKKLGHELRSRPFGYQDTPLQELDSLLLYTSTLNMQARLFRIPVRASCFLLGLAAAVFILLYLTQNH
ncbi:uncharacterized protein [Centruroides vittatus]|uniref:uncharacterized protein isoform X2 n=1 Tax=Centruroides vittatus TaxID=120091 RepID=UPI003510AF03